MRALILSAIIASTLTGCAKGPVGGAIMKWDREQNLRIAKEREELEPIAWGKRYMFCAREFGDRDAYLYGQKRVADQIKKLGRDPEANGERIPQVGGGSTCSQTINALYAEGRI